MDKFGRFLRKIDADKVPAKGDIRHFGPIQIVIGGIDEFFLFCGRHPLLWKAEGTFPNCFDFNKNELVAVPGQ